MMLQLVPSQCSLNQPLTALPTAQMSLAEMAAIPDSETFSCGLREGGQFVP
jgi:hypothetical protein